MSRALTLRRVLVTSALLGGASLLAFSIASGYGATRARAARVRNGGIFRMNVSDTDVQYLDPALDYEQVGGQFLQATCARLLNYQDATGKAGTRLYPEVATGFPKVSRNGKTYTFTIRKGFRFNTGAPVTARSFLRAFVRASSPKMPSPAVQFMDDVVGAKAYNAGKARTLRGVTAQGNKLTIRLTAPTGTLEQRVALTFFCAVPEDLPFATRGVKLPPMAGPYYFAQRIPNKLLVLKRNPYYGGRRPHHVAEIRATMETNVNTDFLQVKKGEIEYAPYSIPPSQYAALGKQYGVNRGRFRVNPMQEVDYLALNTRRGPFKSLKLRKAANYAVDRARQLKVIGKYAGTATDQILPPNIPGFRDVHLYPLAQPDLAKAKQLAGSTKAKVTLLYSIGATADEYVELLRQSLAQIGLTLQTRRVTFDTFATLVGKPSTNYDMALYGWFADFPDPYDFINVLFGDIRPEGNQNIALFNVPAVRRKMNAASRLRGDARYAAYGRLDAEIMRDYAPWVPLDNLNQREFIAADVGCYRAPGSFPQLDLAAVCLK